MPPPATPINWTEVLALIAAIAGIGAFIIAWRDSRRNKRIIVKITEFTALCTVDSSGSLHRLEICLKNFGIEMQDVSLCLGFHGPKGSGWVNLPIPTSDESTSAAGSFLRGATAKFVLTSRNENARPFIHLLRDIREQRPRLGLLSCSFLATDFPLWSRFDRLKAKWNNLAWRLSFTRRMAEGHDGRGVFKTYKLPSFEVRSWKLQNFLNSLAEVGKKDTDKAQT